MHKWLILAVFVLVGCGSDESVKLRVNEGLKAKCKIVEGQPSNDCAEERTHEAPPNNATTWPESL